MSEFAWSEALETGDALVDKQHRDIHDLVDYVEAAEDRPAEVLEVLDRLMQHVDTHFATEEALMRRAGYVGQHADEHVAEHRDLTQSAREQVLMFRSGALASTQQLVGFLREWLATHVYEHDLEFIEYVRSHELQAEPPEPTPGPGSAA